MSNRKFILRSVYILIIFLILGAIVGTAMAKQFHLWPGERIISTSPASSTPQPLTLQEAWDMISSQVQEWRPDAAIISLNSIDNVGDTHLSGQDGHRRAWMAFAYSKSSSNNLWLTTIDGVFVEKIEQSRDTGFQPAAVRPKLDSPDALLFAKTSKPAFEGSVEGKTKGFHFTYEYSQESSSYIERISGEVNGNAAVIELDPSTNKLISARYQIFSGGGILFSSDAGKTWNASNLISNNQMVRTATGDPINENHGYAVIVQDGPLTIYETKDGGESWAFLSQLPAEAGNWAFNIHTIVISKTDISIIVGTRAGLWSLTDISGKWSQISSLPTESIQWLGVIQSQASYRILTSVTTGEKPGLYSSHDLINWNLLATGTNYRLSESFDRKYILATNEEKPNSALLLDFDGQNNIVSPSGTLRAAGDFKNQASTIACADAGVGVLSQPVEKWDSTLVCGSLATSPDFNSSKIAIVGGFRSGIFRSVDAGQTWQVILNDPSILVKGSNEIYEVLFLSPKDVIAINGGFLTWKDF
jgi:photosystem II stability/assembly factor-like uncharacterized protein